MEKLEVDEITQILSLVNYPFITRTDSWWIEELLFQPGQPRTDLLKWTIVKQLECQQPLNGLESMQESILNSTMMSTASNNNNSTFTVKCPETDEGYFSLLINPCSYLLSKCFLSQYRHS